MIGLGAMRLSTERDRHDERAVAVLHAALDAGITFIDTSDAYCHDASEAGHNERLIARALAAWNGDRSRVAVATKGGLTRPNGLWVPDGRAKHLAAACAASIRALAVERIALYQLHAPDPRTPLATSVRALDALQRDGLVERIGLCNVTVAQIEEARAVARIAAVQVELSPWNDGNVLNGVLQYCVTNDLQLLAFRPLGGAKGRRRIDTDEVLAAIAATHAATPREVALAWLAGLAPNVVPLPGSTRPESARSIGSAARLVLTDEERARLDDHFPAGRAFRFRESARQQHQPAQREGEIVLVMGLPAAGKSTVAKTLAARGYARINRDESGGPLRALVPKLEALIASGSSRIVLDNTYVTRKSRAPVIQAARQTGLRVRGLWLSTSVEDAQVNAVTRMVLEHGRLLMPDEMRRAAKENAAAFGPAVQFRYQRELEMPNEAEGFTRIDVLPFVRRHNPTATNRAVIVWCDGVLTRSRSRQRAPTSPDDLEVIEGRGEVLRKYEADGWYVLGISWQPEIAAEQATHEQVFDTFAHMRERLGVEMDVEYCPHAGGPPICWCRKPLPGLGVAFIQRYRLDPRQCIYVGSGALDAGFARRLAFQFREPAAFFGGGGHGD
jgi:aryl-alcohol dehydrogenase-like predicted oxidoreductase/histidinol phosphatase-like enzyme